MHNEIAKRMQGGAARTERIAGAVFLLISDVANATQPCQGGFFRLLAETGADGNPDTGRGYFASFLSFTWSAVSVSVAM